MNGIIIIGNSIAVDLKDVLEIQILSHSIIIELDKIKDGTDLNETITIPFNGNIESEMKMIHQQISVSPTFYDQSKFVFIASDMTNSGLIISKRLFDLADLDVESKSIKFTYSNKSVIFAYSNVYKNNEDMTQWIRDKNTKFNNATLALYALQGEYQL